MQIARLSSTSGANYALTDTMNDASAGAVEANLPFTISYI